MRIRTQCKDCGYPFTAQLEIGSDRLPCPACEVERPVASDGWEDERGGRVDVCPLCGCKHLYRQRDVNRAIGCLIVAVGAALAPWTFGLSLLALTLLDLALYYRLPWAVVCYRCDTVYRDARPGPRHTDFNLLKHDVLKYGKTWTTDDEPPSRRDG